MTESAAQETVAATPVKAPKAKKAASPKSKTALKKAAPTHPPTAQMVNAAIKNLKERGGSSLQAIKKYIATTYKVDAEKIAPFIKKYLKSAVDDGKLIRTKGKGASGSFKLATVAKPEGTKKVAKPKKTTTSEKKPKAVKPKKEKPASPKKVKVASKPKAEKTDKSDKTAKPTKSKVVPKPKKEKSTSVIKPKKVKTSPAKKPKSPKPKKNVAKKVTKKAAATPKK